jgi:iron complex outermembrane receptor protein
VISGPGGTLWGANAMNGVVNIITRPAYVTDGTVVSAGAGNQNQQVSARYGDRINSDTAYRIYGMTFHRAAEELGNGTNAQDGWSKGQGGFRLDWNRGQDAFTVQGDAYRATENEIGTAGGLVIGANALTRWQHQTEHSQIQVQAYVDQTERMEPPGGGGFVLHTYDIEVQQSLQIGPAHRLVWGAGERVNDYAISNTATLLFLPESRNLALGNIFAQDSVSLSTAVQLSLGIKLEDDPFSGWTALPDARLSWAISEAALLWTAASRGIRSPTPFDVDVVEKVGTTVFLTGNPRFSSEKVSAYEIGYRAQPTSHLSVSVSTFYNAYDDLRTIETASSTQFLPLYWGNLMHGNTYGVTAWADWQVNDRWRLSPSLRLLRKHLRFESGASELLGLAQAGDDPTSEGGLTSSIDLSRDITFDATVRYVGSLPDPALKAYCEMTARLGWRVSRTLELALSGSNLLHARHSEYPTPVGEQIGRARVVQARWSF